MKKNTLLIVLGFLALMFSVNTYAKYGLGYRSPGETEKFVSHEFAQHERHHDGAERRDNAYHNHESKPRPFDLNHAPARHLPRYIHHSYFRNRHGSCYELTPKGNRHYVPNHLCYQR